MQYNPFFYSNSLPINSNSFYPYHTFQSVNADIIGEGELISVIFPDGNLHFFFQPTSSRPTFQNNNVNSAAHCNNNIGAYYIRGVSQPIQAAVFSQQRQNMYGVSGPGPYVITENIPLEFQLKFHNDRWTSTTDLHYFLTRLRSTQWYPSRESKECDTVPMEISTEDTNTYSQTEPEKLCPCMRLCNEIRNSKSEKVECRCYNVRNSDSNTSNATTKNSKIKLQKHSRNKRKKHEKKKNKRGRSSECLCHVTCATDKSVTTYADQSTKCFSEESKTQTCPLSREIFTEIDDNIITKKVKKKRKRSNTSRKNKPIGIKSADRNIDKCDSRSTSCCCSENDATYSSDGSDK